MKSWKLVPVLLALLLAVGSLATVGAIAVAATGEETVLVNILDEDGSAISGLTVKIINGTDTIASTSTNSTGWAEFSLSYPENVTAIIATVGPVAWEGVYIEVNKTTEVHIWLNETSNWHKVNVTVLIGSDEGTIEYNATFKATAGSSVINATLSGLQAPVFIYIPATDSSAELTAEIPKSVKKNLVTYELANVTITFTNGSTVYKNETTILIDTTVDSIKIEYKTSVPVILGLPLQTWVIIGLIALLAGVLAVIVKAKKAAAAVMRPSRRVLRDYELSNNHNGILFNALEAFPLDEKERVARRMLRRTD